MNEKKVFVSLVWNGHQKGVKMISILHVLVSIELQIGLS